MLVRRFATNIILILLLSACASATYVPPSHVNRTNDYQVIVYQPYDVVWKKLIQFSAKTFFSIDNYEKESGLITLSFGSSSPEEFVSGGEWKYQGMNGEFSGDYVEFLHKFYRAKLQGKMNIVVSSIDDNKTKVAVHARYVLTVPPTQNSNGDTWAFDTGNCATVRVTNPAPGTPSNRTVCPTYVAEKSIISAIK